MGPVNIYPSAFSAHTERALNCNGRSTKSLLVHYCGGLSAGFPPHISMQTAHHSSIVWAAAVAANRKGGIAAIDVMQQGMGVQHTPPVMPVGPPSHHLVPGPVVGARQLLGCCALEMSSGEGGGARRFFCQRAIEESTKAVLREGGWPGAAEDLLGAEDDPRAEVVCG
ncbi:hypothetical protein E1301_Tti001571 [Triplophysa tibetana]|uniref:Uncharacterized protein n=1 Tax=Triplophysa tibetana TaxID=1572043 RepID=A0A5A9P851_9TELE|nr:hypothetical protein E1301_Tti001571 [Triplophysa tibetana]